MYRHSESHEVKYHRTSRRSIEVCETTPPLSDGVIFQVGVAVEANVGNPTQVVSKACTDFFGKYFVYEAKVAMRTSQDTLQELWILREFI